MSDPSDRYADEYKRKFLVIVDESEECAKAVTFAALRVRRTGGTVVLLSVIEPDDYQHWLGVEEIMRTEAMEAAESMQARQAARIASFGSIKVERVIREGKKAEEIEGQLADDPDIAILVLAAADSAEGPGPLVSSIAARGANALRVPVTIVPGSIPDGDLAALC
ncbi:universal stress protein [Pelagibacterium xiamenense]|uniref:universal stress protein n=1 Tax=Pelagibacterium xiamenense TaxID=2901140 RepID=UPI001E3E3EBF|nr:universal stress protein [Pelagibacterium xiamenense]MCD7058507.1 universal stress protein [Pelagibacterium xiamenense]